MKAKKGDTIKSKNLDPNETWIVTYSGPETAIVKAKSDRSLVLAQKHGDYSIC
jgi:hypothetical protein